MGLRSLMSVNMQKLTPAEFERVLHPVFEEDELTLVRHPPDAAAQYAAPPDAASQFATPLDAAPSLQPRLMPADTDRHRIGRHRWGIAGEGMSLVHGHCRAGQHMVWHAGTGMGLDFTMAELASIQCGAWGG